MESTKMRVHDPKINSCDTHKIALQIIQPCNQKQTIKRYNPTSFLFNRSIAIVKYWIQPDPHLVTDFITKTRDRPCIRREILPDDHKNMSCWHLGEFIMNETFLDQGEIMPMDDYRRQMKNKRLKSSFVNGYQS
jgi:hypothetical protein